MTPILRVENLHHVYDADGNHPVVALDGVNLAVHEGEYLVVLGHNGSGKSTLARHLNALLLPTKGDVWVRDWNTTVQRHLRDIRSTVGMVFQTPDNQIVATIVEEDVAFGPENLGIEHDEIVRRVDWSLAQVEMTAYRKRAPHMLSGGQKQRVCIAGTLAIRPDVLVLDEATAMLDPLGRREVLDIARRLNREMGTTIVAITHFMEEAVDADRVVVMEKGRIVLEGTPREVFRRTEKLRQLHMSVPQVTQLAQALHGAFPSIPTDVLAIDELVDAIEAAGITVMAEAATPRDIAGEGTGGAPLIELDNVSHRYMRDTPLEVTAISNVNLTVRPGKTLGIIGHTGSGKSTIVQHFNALLRPYDGVVHVDGLNIADRDVDLRAVRRTVGLVFQQPEAQLFERYVGDDIAYGPRNLGLSHAEVRARVKEAMAAVGLGFEAFKDRLTFSLSGGEMRRVALAGILALQPKVLVLDEPTSGLDPAGRRQLLDLLLALREQGVTLVIISHNMEELAEVCDRFYVIADGTTAMEGSPAEIFAQESALREMGLGVPPVAAVFGRLAEKGLVAPHVLPVYTVDDAVHVLGGARRGEL